MNVSTGKEMSNMSTPYGEGNSLLLLIYNLVANFVLVSKVKMLGKEN